MNWSHCRRFQSQIYLTVAYSSVPETSIVVQRRLEIHKWATLHTFDTVVYFHYHLHCSTAVNTLWSAKSAAGNSPLFTSAWLRTMPNCFFFFKLKYISVSGFLKICFLIRKEWAPGLRATDRVRRSKSPERQIEALLVLFFSRDSLTQEKYFHWIEEITVRYSRNWHLFSLSINVFIYYQNNWQFI